MGSTKTSQGSTWTLFPKYTCKAKSSSGVSLIYSSQNSGLNKDRLFSYDSLVFVFFGFQFLKNLLIYILYLRNSFLSHVQSTNKPIKVILYFCYIVLISSISFDSFLGFPSLYLHCSSVLACCPLHPLEPLAYST